MALPILLLASLLFHNQEAALAFVVRPPRQSQPPLLPSASTALEVDAEASASPPLSPPLLSSLSSEVASVPSA
eukprot:CAMPEP_0178675198 /NCGR_PEP_ID=MMETSP0698-20121128/35263_1 /TAXON_ID=265572 /ORGANISM="Extubocellulus spinifer, Strain CCMP396" /LENGTH=72 /DNA_ID=CAMNT_0020319371 /DNA_START=34 /DNA_END=249 /DNA_ORIENTATION=-